MRASYNKSSSRRKIAELCFLRHLLNIITIEEQAAGLLLLFYKKSVTSFAIQLSLRIERFSYILSLAPIIPAIALKHNKKNAGHPGFVYNNQSSLIISNLSIVENTGFSIFSHFFAHILTIFHLFCPFFSFFLYLCTFIFNFCIKKALRLLAGLLYQVTVKFTRRSLGGPLQRKCLTYQYIL
jgi:hypothetical protein